jgi:peptide/nickel transport system ATP-binding protein
VVNNAELIIADEPTPGLHPEIVQETLGHLREIADAGSAVVLITHDIGTALNIADRIAVFYAGTVVEVSPADDFKNNGKDLRHPYTQALWQALPENEFVPISGSQPIWNDLPPGCLFEPRCTVKTAACMDGIPPMRELRSGKVRCIHAS